MQITVGLAQSLSLLAFAWYGTTALRSREMVAEFERYGLARLRVLTAVLQITGSVGLLAGFVYRPLLLVSAGGLTVMMVLGTNQSRALPPTRPTAFKSPSLAIPTTSVQNTSGAIIILISRKKISLKIE